MKLIASCKGYNGEQDLAFIHRNLRYRFALFTHFSSETIKDLIHFRNGSFIKEQACVEGWVFLD